MNSRATKESVEGRFEKVLSYYWDGVPVPLLSDTHKQCTQTFAFRQLAFTPDYHGETVSVSLVEPVQTTLFASLSAQVRGPQPASCRIGSHYSLYVGLFRFIDDQRSNKSSIVDEKTAVRVPAEYCENNDEFAKDMYLAHCRVRTGKLVALYKPLIKEHLPLSRNSLRNIIVLSSRGCTSVSREAIAREISDVNEEYAKALSEAIFYYMCLNPLQRRILQPLQLATEPDIPSWAFRKQLCFDKALSRRHFDDARQQLAKQLLWSSSTHGYFAALQALWESRFDQLSFLSTDIFAGTVEVTAFLTRISNSINSAISRVRIEFYANVEEFFYSLIPTAKAALLISEKEYEESSFKCIFLATEIFLVNKLRPLLFAGLDNLVAFFECEGRGSTSRLSRLATQRSFLRLELLAGESFQPRSPALALLLFGIRDLFTEMESSINNLPSFGYVVLRTLKLEPKKISVVSRVEMASYRASIASVLNSVTTVIDQILSSYKAFCSIPALSITAAKTGTNVEITDHVKAARQQIVDIYRTSRQLMYCGRFEVSCAALQETLVREWENYLSTLTSTYQKTVINIVESAKSRSSTIFKVFDSVPSNVEELEAHLQNTEAAKLLAHELRNSDCRHILTRIACMEDLYIPIEPDVCTAVFEFMKLPDELLRGAEKAADVRTRCVPLLQRKLDQLRTTTKEYVQTMSTGVTELYHLFNMETCDIAAQTCAELRELVDRIETNLKRIAHEEEVLGTSAEHAFDSFPTLLHYFEVIEQFWNSVFDATKLRDMYNSPIGTVNATASVEKVREWRRLIHSAARHLRGFPLLLQLGREQEVALSKYEELELFLELVSSPNLRKNHWKDIAKLIATQLREDVASVMDLSVTVKRLLDAGLMEHMGPLGQISNQAQCDYEVESALEEMRSYGKRTHFAFDNSCIGGDSRVIVARQFISEVAEHVEQFVVRCRAMRRYPNLGQLVQKPLLEWEFACDKSGEVFASFDLMQARAAWVEDCLQTLQQIAPSGKGRADGSRRAAIEHLSSASEAMKRLYTTLRKPQFSLYTAMVQDTIQDAFLAVKAAVDNALELLRESLEQRRSAYPRLRFLSDAQLVNLQSVLCPSSFVPLFPNLFGQLAGVETVEGEVTAVVAVDGASLALTSPIPLAAVSPDVWLAQLDHVMRRSLLAAVKGCVAAYHRTDLATWVSAWCGQVVVLALRILHTEGIRHAVQIGGVDALRAYASKVSDVCCALSRLALEAAGKGIDGQSSNGGSSDNVRAEIQAALAYEQFALQEIKLAIEWEVCSIADLDCTGLLQTFFSASGDRIQVSFMGVCFDYGLEFLGHGGPPLVCGSQWKQMVMLLADVELRRGAPLVCGVDDAEVGDDVLKTAAQVLGRFYLRVELSPQTITETLAPVVRGCMETGAFLCLANCETVSPAVMSNCVLPLVHAYRASVPSTRCELPFGSQGAAVSVPVHPFFRLAFNSPSAKAFPLSLATLCEAVCIAPSDTAELMHCVLTHAGSIALGPLSVEELELAELYEQLQARAPDIFTVKRLRVILCDLIARKDGTAENEDGFAIEPPVLTLPQRFLASLMHTSCGAFHGERGTALLRSVNAQIEAKLLLPSCESTLLRDPFSAAADDEALATFDGAKQRFATMIGLHRRVLILGPRFSGKSELWQSWVGATPPLVLSPQLMSAADFYGSPTQRGFLAQVASLAPLSAADGTATPVVVLEGVDAPSSFQLFAQTWLDAARAPEGAASGACVVAPPDLRVIATAAELGHITPGVVDGFAMLALPLTPCWKRTLRWALSAVPERESARKVLEVLLPPLVDRAAKMSPDIVGSPNESANMCAIAQRAAALCCRWYSYALSIRIHSDVLAPRDDDDEVDLSLFAARCAVMAASWSVGLSLPSEDRDAVKLTLLAAEADVVKALAGSGLTGEVFPELTYKSINPLELVVLPQGWMPLDDAARRTDLSLSWSGYSNTNPQLQASLQVFAMPARVATLRSIECLVNCGQHVLLHGGAVSGKTTLLGSMRTCEDWVTQVFQMNAGFRATEVQQTMARALLRRGNGRYGPPLGRRLVVCIDDLHLSPAAPGDKRSPLAAAFMNYCEKFRAISTPAAGTIPITDVVFCASALLREPSREGARSSVGASSGCVDVLLSPFSGDEIARGLLQMCDMASSRKRAKGFSQEYVAFLDLVHDSYCQLKHRLASLTGLTASTSASYPVAMLESGQANLGLLTAGAKDSRVADDSAAATLQVSSSFLFTEHLRELLGAAEVVRMHLFSTLSDSQVSAHVFVDVTTFYEELLCPSTNTSSACLAGKAERMHRGSISREFRDAVVQAAEGTLRNSIRGNADFRDLAGELPEPLSRDVVSAEDESRVAQRIVCFHSALEEEEETDLSTVRDRGKANPVKWTHRSGPTIRAETRNASVLLSYPDSFKVAAVRAEGANKEVYVRQLSSAAAVASAKSSRQASSASTMMSETSSVEPHQPPPSMATPTYQTTWLTTRLVRLTNSLSVPGSHLLFLGDNTFGIRRLFRLWCASSHVPFIWFRVQAASVHSDAISTFVAELRTVITFVCRHSVHAAAYLPPPLLRAPEVLRIMDAIVRSGDVSSLFTDEERFALVGGSCAPHARSLRPFIFADDCELRERVRSCMNFVFHLRDAAEARQLGEGYPFLLGPGTTAVPVYTVELERSLLEEIALGILHGTDACPNGICKLEDEDDASKAAAAGEDASANGDEVGKGLSPRAACVALCAVFDYVRKAHPTPVEQFVEFVRLYKELDCTARVQVLASARTGKVIAGRGDAAVQAVRAATQRSRTIVDELAAVQLKVALLTEKLQGQERQHAARVAEAERLHETVQKEKDAILKDEDAVAKGLEKAKEAVTKSLRHLRKSKWGVVRALSMSRVPDKGPLLARALYAVLGEEVPNHNDSASELWTLSMRRVCTKEFTAELAQAAPETATSRLSALLPFRRELDTVRYAPALPYAQLLADFVVSWVDCVKFLAVDHAAKAAEIAQARQKLEEDEAADGEKQEEVAAAETTAAETQGELETLQKIHAALQKEQSDLAGGEGRLLRYTGLVDRFTRFLVGSSNVAERIRRARCATGDTLLVAAFYTLLAMHADAPSMAAALQDLVKDTVRDTALCFSPLHEVCAQFLYQTHAPRMESLTAVDCAVPWEYKALLLSLFQRRASRWTLVGGADPVISYELLKFLSLCCNGSVTVSAVDPSARDRLVTAMRSGEGVLLRDVHGAASLDLVRSLTPIYQKLKEYHADLHHKQWAPQDARGDGPGGGAASSRQNASKRPSALPFMSVWFDEQEVSVHPQFFLVCTCFPVMTSGLPEACESLDVFNLHTPLSHDARLEWLLYAVVRKPSMSTKIASMQDEVQARQQAYFGILQNFAEAHDLAAELLATDLREISGNQRGDALLAEMEKALALVDTYDGQMAQTTSYVQSLQRMVQEGWDAILPAMKAAARATLQIETNRLGRPWNASGIDSCITDISDISPALIRRIAPLSFSELPTGQKCYYALMQYLQRVVEARELGWPVALRGIFSLSVLCSAMSAAPAAVAEEAKALMLTEAQRRVLTGLVYDSPTDGAAGKIGTADAGSGSTSSFLSQGAADSEGDDHVAAAVRRLYATSGDTLLQRLAGSGGGGGDVTEEEEAQQNGLDAGGETAYDIAQLFAALLKVDVERASWYATSVYNTFMDSVTRLHKGVDHVPPRLPARESLAEAPQSTTTASHFLGAPLTDGSGVDKAVNGRTTGEMTDSGAPRVELPTVDAQIQRAMKTHMPLCLVSESHVDDALMWLQSEVSETKWVFKWQELLPPSSALPTSSKMSRSDVFVSVQGKAHLVQAFEKAMRDVVSLALAPCACGTCGVVLALVVDLKVGCDATTDATAAADNLLLFREQWHRLLSLYTSVSALRARGGNTPTLCLAVINTVAAHETIWGQASMEASASQLGSNIAFRAGTALCCCYFALSINTPQLALAELLRPSRRCFTKDGTLQVCDVILMQVQKEMTARSGQAASTEKRVARVRGPALAKLNASRGANVLSVPLPALPPDLSTGALVALQKAVSELRTCACMLQYEVTVAYVASTTRLHLLYTAMTTAAAPAWLAQQKGRKLWQRRIYDPAPLQRLHTLLSAWVQKRYGELMVQLGGSPGTEVSASEAGSGVLPAAITFTKAPAPHMCPLSSLPCPIRTPTHRDFTAEHSCNGGVQAYYYMRRRQPAWGLLLQKAERLLIDAASAAGPIGDSEPTIELLDPVLCSTMRMTDTRVLHDESANTAPCTAAISADETANPYLHAHQDEQEGEVREAGLRWKTGLFELARKFAHYFLCTRDARSRIGVADSTFPATEQRAQWDLLRAFIGAADDDTGQVSFLWGPLAGSDSAKLGTTHELLLSVRHLESFPSDVANAPSDLVELCGEACLIERFRTRYQQELRHLCFSPAVCGASASALANSATADGAAEEEVQGDTGGSQHEAALALCVLQDACAEMHKRPSSAALSPQEAVLEWESASLDACASQPFVLTPSFQQMIQSFTFAVAPHRVKAVDAAHFDDIDMRFLHLWLPALQHPCFDLQYLTFGAAAERPRALLRNGAALSPRAHCPGRSGVDPFADLSFDGIKGNLLASARRCGEVATALIVVVTQKRFLSHCDVVLCGAQLSPSLLQQVCKLTGWRRGSVGQDTSAGAEAVKRTNTAEGMVVVVRRALLRRGSAKGDGAATADNLGGSLGRDDGARQTLVEVGMHGQRTDPLSPEWIWCRTVCVQAAVEGALWDTRPTSHSHSKASTSRSPSAARSGSNAPEARRATENFFMTEVAGEGESRSSQVGHTLSVQRAWSFSDVPVPVRWCSVNGDTQSNVAEFPLCVEYELLDRTGITVPELSTTSAPLSTGEAVDMGVAVGSTFPVREALDAYLLIV